MTEEKETKDAITHVTLEHLITAVSQLINVCAIV